MNQPGSPVSTGLLVASAAFTEALRKAAALYDAGDWALAEETCRHILHERSDHPGALHLLGMIAAQTGRGELAAELLGRAVSHKPRDASIRNNLGNVLRALKRLEEAVASYALAIELRPEYAEAHNNLGVVLQALGRLDEALASYERAIELTPNFAEALYNRGNVLRELGRFVEAIESYDCCLRLNPTFAHAHVNRGNTLQAFGKFDEAVACYDRALAIRNEHPEAHFGRARALHRLGRLEEALRSYDRALHVRPDHAEAHNDRGMVLRELRRSSDALASYTRAIELDPQLAEAHNNRGVTLQELRDLEGALESYSRAIGAQPEFAEAHTNRGNVLQALGRFGEAAESYERALRLEPDQPGLYGDWLHARAQTCEWSGLESHLRELESRIARRNAAAVPFTMLCLVDRPSLQQQAAELWVEKTCPAVAALPPIPRRARRRKIRVGYFSADFHNHATAYLAAGLFERHDRRRFDVIGFSFGPAARDEMSRRLTAAFDSLIDVRDVSDLCVAQQARDLEIDIAVDLKGFTLDHRLGIFAHRAAPIQVNYLGYPGTVGARYIDYIVADTVLIPAEHRAHYTENIVYLPHSYQVNDGRPELAAASCSREEHGLPPSGFVFCCFNNLYKVMPGTFDSWMRILRGVPGSVLWLLGENEAAASNLRAEARARGVSGERLIFARRMPIRVHLARHRAAGLFLDTLPYNAHTTASDALWAGVPVLTCIGESFASRVAASLLTATGLPGLISTHPEQYVRTAIDLASAPDRLASLQECLRQERSTCPLFDAARFARHLEHAYELMYERWQADLGPAHLFVPPG